MSKRKVQPKIAPILSPRRHVLKIFICLSLTAVTFALFEPVRNHTFLIYDDDKYVTENPPVKSGLTLRGVIWAFTTMHEGNWHPLTWLSHMLDCQLYGLNAGGHHLTNLVLHIASALLLLFVLERMTGSLWRSSFVAALFALHPLHVESVAWVAERKDVLSAFFWMLTMWTYARYVERPGLNRYLLALLPFTLGLLSKPMLVTLPFVLVLIDYWPLRRFQFPHLKGNPKPSTSKPNDGVSQKSMFLSLLWEKVPFFILSAFSSILTFVVQQRMGAVASMEIFPFEIRIANALISYVSYIGKMIWPHKLAVFYPHPVTLPLWKVIGSGLLIVGSSILVIRALRKHPYHGVGWFWYLGTLVPVIGLVQVGAQAMADRYTYLPLIGLFIMIAWGVLEQCPRWRYRNVVLSASAGVVLLILMTVTRLQVNHWQNDITLFKHSLAVTSDNFVLHNNLGMALALQGKTEEAIAHYAEALRISPHHFITHYNLGLALGEQGKIEEAMAHFTEAIRIRPDYMLAHHNLGIALARRGQIREAITCFTKALQINPDYAEGHLNLGFAYLMVGDRDAALKQYNILKTVNPDFAARLHDKIFK